MGRLCREAEIENLEGRAEEWCRVSEEPGAEAWNAPGTGLQRDESQYFRLVTRGRKRRFVGLEG